MHSYNPSPEPKEWPDTYWKRPIPEAHWRGVGLLTALLVLAFMIAWETYWRLEGYEPSLEQTPELWARTRDKAGTGSSDEVVYTGSSRILYGFDLDVWQQDFGGPRPIGLARGGTNPRAFLKDLAEDPDFNGLLLVGVTEGLFFSPDVSFGGNRATEVLDYRKNRSISSRSEYLLSIPLQSAFASLNSDLTLSKLVRNEWLKLPNRVNAMVPPELPPYFGGIDSDRRVKMWHKCEREPALQQKIQQIWMPLFTMDAPMEGEPLDQIFTSVRADVERIHERRGQVVFVRFPSSGELRELELEKHPRIKYFDRLIRETGAIGIHFEDHEGLHGYNCPEWSHLTRADAVTFTRNLIPVIEAKLAM
jgi:hypothetical protein